MSLIQLNTRAQLGIEAPPVRVEVHIGLPAFTVVGLPETAVREARDRVRSAIINSGFDFPARRITVNLAPADLPKVGGRYDLPIALGILGASEQIDASSILSTDCFGELALSGECREITGLLPALLASKQTGSAAIIPTGNQHEAALISEASIQLTGSLAQICAGLNGGTPLPWSKLSEATAMNCEDALDLSDVHAQYQAKRALEIAAAGGHHLLMMGPPGTGKSMLAQRIGSILPKLTETEAMSCASIRSVCQLPINLENWRQPPFRSPHHTVSDVALVGGGRNPRPGEISLAHHGVLFLDELTEFNRRSIEVLREPLETGSINISRAAGQSTFPAKFQLVAAMNPCPGGCDTVQSCDCGADMLRRYRNKISAPFLDRIDIQIEIGRVDHQTLLSAPTAMPTSLAIQAKVIIARERQLIRQGCINSQLSASALKQHCKLDTATRNLLQQACEKLNLSARSSHKMIKLARTIADLEGVSAIAQGHIAEAISYRGRDRLKF